jgi:membrane peptidoglycan carboxypeptidase
VINPDLVQRYVDVEQSVQVLRRRYAAGVLTRDQLQAELRKLMILDDEGFWWMIGLETDRWYKYNGKDWVPATPPGRPEPGPEAPAPAPAPLGVPKIPTASTQGAVPQGQFDIPLDEYGMPLPQHVPIEDPGATIVGASAPRLDSALRSEPATQPHGSRLADRSPQAGVAPYDGGVTMPSSAAQASQLTQPGMAASAAGAVRFSAATQVPAAVPSPRLKPGFQPDYGEKPKGMLEDRQRMAGCLIRLAIVGVFLMLAVTLVAIVLAVMGYFSIINQYDAKINALGQTVQSAAQSARILDKNGRVLYQLNDPNTGPRIPVKLDQVSPYMIAATVAVENKRFYSDPGFDILALSRAMVENVKTGGASGGASSITQQLTRALVLDPGAAQDRSISRKTTEIIVSTEIARRYTKSQILEFYLNTVYYGNLAYGVEAAAQTYFGKSAKDLNLAEAAFLAGEVQSPATYDPVLHRQAALNRYDDVLGLVGALGCIHMEHLPPDQSTLCITPKDIDVVQVAQVKARRFNPPTTNVIYPHFVNYVEQLLEAKFGKDAIYSSGFNVYTTIDPSVQDVADAAVKNEIARLRGANVTNGAVLAVRPSDGAIVAMVGSADFNNKDIQGEFNVTLAPRQTGSSIKPIEYAAALENNNGSYWTPATIIWDVPSCFGGQPPYCPVNYDRQMHGPQPLRYALGNSFNVAAVKTLQYIGIDRFKNIANRVGLSFKLTQPETAGLATALGAVEMSLIDMVHAYSVFADGGKRVDLYAISKVTRKVGDHEETVFEATDHPATQVIDPAIAFLITNILSDNNARLLEFGRNSALVLRDGRPAAVKTGTTNDFKDNWTIGYTPQLVVGVWVGNNNNTPMRVQSGISGAAPIWNATMTGALAGQPAMQFQPPPGIVQVPICADYGTQDFPECPNHSTEFFAQPNLPPPASDVFRTLQIDSFSGLIANENCPDFVQNKTFLVLNDETAAAWLNSDPRGGEWAKQHNIELPVVPPPTAACDKDTPRPVLHLTSPTPNSVVQGLLEVRGSVSIPNFNRYQIEVSPGFNTSQFQIVSGPTVSMPAVDNSLLGAWDTASVPNGPYTLRLIGIDGQGHHAEITVLITVNNIAATPQTAPPPVIVPTEASQPGQPVQVTMTPIVINPNPPTATLRSVFPPTSTPNP